MRVIWKAACAAVLLIAATTIEIGCGETYRPVAVPLPVTTGNPSGVETEVVLSCCLNPTSPNAVSEVPSSVITNINVTGDANAGNKVLANIVGDGSKPVSDWVNPIAFDYSRTTVFSTNTAADSVTQAFLGTSTAGFSALTATISLEAGSAPIGMSFQYFGSTYTQDYVVNSGKTATCPNGGSLGVIVQATAQLKATICLDAQAADSNTQTHANPVLAWIYKDQSKVFVLDDVSSKVYVVSVSKNKVTNTIQLPDGSKPFKAAQSADGNYIYILNSTLNLVGDGSISVIDGLAETVLETVSTTNTLSSSLPIDIAQDLNFNDTSLSTQAKHIWVLQADGTVSVYDASTAGQLNRIKSLATTTTISPTAVPTNFALMRDGSQVYVGVKNTDKIIAIDTASFALTTITVGVHRNISQTLYDNTVTPPVAHANMHVETTTPTVTSVAVSRGGNSADLSKAYATTLTTTIYNCYDATVTATDCANTNPFDGKPYLAPGCAYAAADHTLMSCPNLYNGTAVVYAVDNGSVPNHIPINTYVTTIPAPAVVTYCDAGNPATGEYDGQKYCPLMTPQVILGRS